MAKHDQRINKRFMTCANCRNGSCERCIDVLRSAYSDEEVCTCQRPDHETDVGTAIMDKDLTQIRLGIMGQGDG